LLVPTQRSNRNILIVGLAKTGTSALYTSLKQAMSGVSVLEIGNPRQIEYLAGRTDVDRVSKLLVPRYPQLRPYLGTFTHMVRIARDPRDVVVSWLLFRPFLHDNWHNAAYVDEFVQLLRKKEADPPSVSLADFRDVFNRHEIPWVGPKSCREWFVIEDQFLIDHPLALSLRYEDYLRGSMPVAEAFLQMPLTSDVDLGSYNSYNQRSKSSGSWRHWFTKDDVEEFAPALDRYLERHGYDRSWSLADDPAIDSATASEHVVKNVEKLRREPPSTGWLRPRETYTESYVGGLVSALNDGREPAMIEYALALRYGWGVAIDRNASRNLLRDVVARGNPIANAHLIVDLEHGIGGPVETKAARDMEEKLRTGSETARRAGPAIERARNEWKEHGA
jgi:hypothetical protein